MLLLPLLMLIYDEDSACPGTCESNRLSGFAMVAFCVVKIDLSDLRECSFWLEQNSIAIWWSELDSYAQG